MKTMPFSVPLARTCSTLGLGLCLCLLQPVAAEAKIYVYVGADGSRVVTDHPFEKPGFHILHAQQTVHNIGDVLAGRQDSAVDGDVSTSPEHYDSYILTASEKYKLDPALVKAVIHAESNFNPLAISSKGARGLMQLMPETAARYNEYNLFSPPSNINAGTRHLSYLLERYSHNEILALAAYNAGEDMVDRYQGIPPFRETRQYVRRVMQYHNQYRRHAIDTATRL